MFEKDRKFFYSFLFKNNDICRDWRNQKVSCLLGAHTKRIHTGNNKEFTCDNCMASFKSRKELKRHISAVHEKKKPFKCVDCSSTFSRKEHMKKHISSFHEGIKPLMCEICEKYLRGKNDLKRHILKGSFFSKRFKKIYISLIFHNFFL